MSQLKINILTSAYWTELSGELQSRLLPAENDLRYPLKRNLGELQIQSACSREDKNQPPNAAGYKTTI